ncbi:hypothetical protein ACLQ26_21685 [Micromonospora sp. DT43]|uniref:hypothetical protein n=1 Tax=Micromonospora sp. DT43 TaxID=3393440 RepID=UPI003CEE53C1
MTDAQVGVTVAAVPPERDIGAGWSAARKVAGYSAASAMSLYLLVKVVWIAVALHRRAGAGPGLGQADSPRDR